MRTRAARFGAFALALTFSPSAAGATSDLPHYDHVFIIIDENKGFDQLMDHPEWTPEIHRLAAHYGLATQFYAEVHPSEANYIALLAGDTFGIHDDDAYFCKPGPRSEYCGKSESPDYVAHDLTARVLMDQLDAKGLTWRSYAESIPEPGSLVPRWPERDHPVAGVPSGIYAAKHNGFVSFHSVNAKPPAWRAEHLVGFDRLEADLAADRMPNYAHIVPNICNDMHGMGAKSGAPADCSGEALIRRGDAEIGRLVGRIMASKVWRDQGNTAIVVTFDENDKDERGGGVPQGCCGYDPKSAANFGGGRIVTLVITNYGGHVVDPTPYNHYSLLRTVEDVFGIREHLGHAADTQKGVVDMTPLFASQPR